MRISYRGSIEKFSDKSRKRLIDIINRINVPQKSLFITLTYGQKFPEPKTAKKHLKAFMRVIVAKFPRAAGIWRMEFQQRGAPHFHMIVFNMGWWDKISMARYWLAIIGDEFGDNSNEKTRPPFTRIELITNQRKAIAYVCKYVAKSDDRVQAGSGFNCLPYQNIHPSAPGRFWGYFGRQRIPFATLVVLTIAHEWVFLALKRKATKESQHMRKIDRDVGFTIYSDKASSYLRIAIVGMS